MPNWLILQIALLLVWLIIAFIFYYGGLWTASGPVNRKEIFRFLFFKIVPSVWLASSLLVGLYLLIMNSSQLPKSALVMTIILPIVTLFLIIGSLIHENNDLKRKENENERKMELKKNECEDWVNSITFLTPNDVTLKLYLSNEKATGRIIITNVTDEQSKIIKENYKESLPKGIFLEVISKDNILH